MRSDRLKLIAAWLALLVVIVVGGVAGSGAYIRWVMQGQPLVLGADPHGEHLVARELFGSGTWTTPRTWSTGEIVTASMLNTHVRDNLQVLKDQTDALTAMASSQFGANLTPASNSGTGETTLQTITLPASTLATNGDLARVLALGSFAATANNKTVRLKVGSTTVATITGTYSGVGWSMEITVARTSATTALVWGGTVVPVGSHYAGAFPAAVTVDLASDATITITGQSDTASGDVTASLLTGWAVR